MDVVLFLLFGLFVGILARFIVPGRESGGWVLSMALGVGGSFLGGFLSRMIGVGGGGRTAGFVMSLAGAIILVVAYQMFTRRRAMA